VDVLSRIFLSIFEALLSGMFGMSVRHRMSCKFFGLDMAIRICVKLSWPLSVLSYS